MKHLVFFVLVLGALSGVGQIKDEAWLRVPATEKVYFKFSLAGATIDIQAVICTCENFSALLGRVEESDCKFVKAVQAYFGGRQFLIVYIGNFGRQRAVFVPLFFAFTQGNRQFAVTAKDIGAFDNTFTSGVLLPGVVTWGFVAIPAELDLTKNFRFWYYDVYGEFKREGR